VLKASDEFLLKLQKLGFKADRNTKQLAGTIPVANLNKLAGLPEVVFVKYIPEKPRS
jgi:hypothetical protein